MNITTAKIKELVREKYVWPGGYEIVFITRDGALLCVDCVRANWREVVDSVGHSINDGWRVVGWAWEAVSPDATIDLAGESYISNCDHCSKTFGELADG